MTSDSGFKGIRRTPNILESAVCTGYQINNIIGIAIDIFLDDIRKWNLMASRTKGFCNISVLANFTDIVPPFVKALST